MPRSRMIKPEFWDDEKLAKISRDARLIFIGLWNHSDDFGVVKGHSVWLKNHIFPYDNALTINQFSKWISELEKINAIIPFFYNSEKYFYIRKFGHHQTINKPSKTLKNPSPPENILEGCSSTTVALLPETETETEEETETEGKKPAPKKNKKFSPPTQKEVEEYFEENGFLKAVGSKAWKYYQTGNWKDARGQPVKSWKQKMISVWFKDENKKPVQKTTMEKETENYIEELQNVEKVPMPKDFKANISKIGKNI